MINSQWPITPKLKWQKTNLNINSMWKFKIGAWTPGQGPGIQLNYVIDTWSSSFLDSPDLIRSPYLEKWNQNSQSEQTFEHTIELLRSSFLLVHTFAQARNTHQKGDWGIVSLENQASCRERSSRRDIYTFHWRNERIVALLSAPWYALCAIGSPFLRLVAIWTV